MVEIALFERGWVTLNANFRGKGVSPTNEFWHLKTRVPTRQTVKYGTHVVITWRMWANISHMGSMWELDGVLLPIWEEYGSSMGENI